MNGRRFSAVWLAGVVALLSVRAVAAPAQTQPVLPDLVTFPDGETKVVIPVEKGGHLLFARVKINGRDVGWLAVDTGATTTMLDAAAAERLGLVKTETRETGTFGGSVDAGVCKVRSLSVGPVELGAHEILLVDLGFLGKVTDGRAVGMLGGDLLAVLPFTLDYRARTLTLHHPAHFKPPAGARCDDLEFFQNIPSIVARLAGKHDVSLMLDTGGSGLEIGLPFIRKHTGLVAGKARDSSLSLSPGGLFEGVSVGFTGLRVFGRDANEVSLGFGSASRVSGRKDAGILGAGVLQALRLTLDYRRGKCWSEPNPPESIRELLGRKGDVNRPDFAGRVPLMGAKDVAEATALLAAGADVRHRDYGGFTPLGAAATRRDVALVNLLLARGADAKTRDMLGLTPLLDASGKSGSTAMVKRLLAAGADPNQKANDGKAALTIAQELGHENVVKLFQAAAAGGKK
jgi:hypothetical protein